MCGGVCQRPSDVHSTWTSLGFFLHPACVLKSRKDENILFNDALNTFYLWLYGRKEGNVLFNDALNTFYLWLYGRKEGNVFFKDALNTFYLWLYGRKEGNVLFNDALNTFFLRLYSIRYTVKDHSDSERGNLLPPHGLLFPISSKGRFIRTIP